MTCSIEFSGQAFVANAISCIQSVTLTTSLMTLNIGYRDKALIRCHFTCRMTDMSLSLHFRREGVTRLEQDDA